MGIETTHNSYAQEMETELLCIAVDETVSTIRAATSLGEHEILEILESLDANGVNEVGRMVELLKDFEPVKRAGAAKLGAVIEESIMAVANTAAIDPDKLARILTRENSGSVSDIVGLLRAGNSLAGHA